MNVQRKTLTKLLAKYRRTGSVADLPRQPRRRATTAVQDQFIVLSHLRQRTRTAVETARETVGTHGQFISSNTVRRRLKSAGLRARRPYHGIVLTRDHRRARLNWARAHLRFTRADWANVLFTDESRFNVQGSDGRVRVYRRRGERYTEPCVVERDQFRGGSVMIWAGISLHLKTPLVVVRGNLNAARYQDEILRPVVIPVIHQNRGMTLMHDGATSHTALTTRTLLRQRGVNVLPWPSKSPDLNPIENIWDELGRRVYRSPNPPVNPMELQDRLLQEWANMPVAFFRNYIMSMRSRCLAVIRANGGHTRY